MKKILSISIVLLLAGLLSASVGIPSGHELKYKSPLKKSVKETANNHCRCFNTNYNHSILLQVNFCKKRNNTISFPLPDETRKTEHPDLEFIANRLRKGFVLLDWTTIGELNNTGFSLQRKLENEKNFKDIAYVKPFTKSGNTLQKFFYTYNDSNSNSGITTYRIRQTDNNKNPVFSVVRLVIGGAENANDYPKDLVLLAGDSLQRELSEPVL